MLLIYWALIRSIGAHPLQSRTRCRGKAGDDGGQASSAILGGAGYEFWPYIGLTILEVATCHPTVPKAPRHSRTASIDATTGAFRIVGAR